VKARVSLTCFGKKKEDEVDSFFWERGKGGGKPMVRLHYGIYGGRGLIVPQGGKGESSTS